VDTAISSGGNRSVNQLTDRASWLYLAINVALLPVYFLVTRAAAQKVLWSRFLLWSTAACVVRWSSAGSRTAGAMSFRRSHC
jgi:hypothetical protein